MSNTDDTLKPHGHPLRRYGIRWSGPHEPVCEPMDDGYWTPWHIADAAIYDLRDQRDNAQIAVAMKQGEIADLSDRIAALEAQAEVDRMRLAACGVLAGCDTQESLDRNIGIDREYMCGAVESCVDAARQQIALLNRIARLAAEVRARRNCEVLMTDPEENEATRLAAAAVDAHGDLKENT